MDESVLGYSHICLEHFNIKGRKLTLMEKGIETEAHKVYKYWY